MDAMKVLRLLLLAISWLMPSAAVHAQGDGPLIAALSEARAQGCANGAAAAALRPSAPLNEAARRIAKGQEPMQAASSAGYRAKRIFHASLSGYESAAAVAQAMREHYCAALADPGLREAGVHGEGDHWWIVLAAPYEVPQPGDAQAVAQRLLTLTNTARATPRRCGSRKFGVAPPLLANARLARAAQAHSNDMAAHDYLEHRGRDGSTASQRLTRAGYGLRDVGENIAAGQATPDDVMQDWLKSPEHCTNIMEPSFTEMGTAFAVNMQSGLVIYWTQVFARPR